MNPAPHWYVDPIDPTKRRYWTGKRFNNEVRPVQSDTPTFPVDAETQNQLVHHSVGSNCDPNFGCDGTTHPYRAAGYGLLAGGLVQAVAVVAALCTATDKLKSAGQA